MDEWYIPITILPAVGLLLLSTSNLIIALNQEIKELLDAAQCEKQLVAHKIVQLTILSYTMVALYIAAAGMVISGLTNGITDFGLSLNRGFSFYTMIVSACLILLAIILLIIYAFRAVSIRKQQFSKFLNSK